MRPFQPRYNDPPLCFCGKPATRSLTISFGIVYDCHFMQDSSSNPEQNVKHSGANTKLEREIDSIVDSLRELSQDDTVSFVDCSSTSRSLRKSITTTEKKEICGFHIHKKVWDTFFFSHTPPYLYNDNFEHRELKLCPYFNFTFCVYFRLSNPFSKQYHITPKCFCGYNVIINRTYREGKNYRRYGFGCSKYKIGGCREKCTWFLWAEMLRFKRPLEDIHALYPSHEHHNLSQQPDNVECGELARVPSSSTSSDIDSHVDIITPDSHIIFADEEKSILSAPTGLSETLRSPIEFRALEAEAQHLHLANNRLHQVIHDSQEKNAKLSQRIRELELYVREQQESRDVVTDCRVCFERSVTHAITPCFHLALCEKCANTVAECCICRVKKAGIQRIYMA